MLIIRGRVVGVVIVDCVVMSASVTVLFSAVVGDVLVDVVDVGVDVVCWCCWWWWWR